MVIFLLLEPLYSASFLSSNLANHKSEQSTFVHFLSDPTSSAKIHRNFQNINKPENQLGLGSENESEINLNLSELLNY